MCIALLLLYCPIGQFIEFYIHEYCVLYVPCDGQSFTRLHIDKWCCTAQGQYLLHFCLACNDIPVTESLQFQDGHASEHT